MRDIFGDKKKAYTRENLIKIRTSQLEVGMFVAELDIPWSETPFLVQGFEIRHRSNVMKLEKYCDNVYVLEEARAAKKTSSSKPSKALRPPPKNSTGFMINQAKTQRKAYKKKLLRSGPAYERQISAEAEHTQARDIYARAKEQTNGLLYAVQQSEVFDMPTARNIVASCVDSILRNPDALIWMSKIKHELDYTTEHCLDVCILTIVFGRYLRFSVEELHEIGLCGLSHGIGKMKIPAEILEKSGSLNAEEREIVERHTLEGHKLLFNATSASKTVIDAALFHQERPDGEGYPRGLHGEKIPEYARIIGVVNAYDAIISDRCYMNAKSPEEAQKIIYDGRGTQFDEECALTFMRAIGPYPAGTWVELRNGMVCVVVEGQPKFRHLPTVIVATDENKNMVKEKMLDLYLTDSGELDGGYLIKNTLPDGSYDLHLEEFVLVV